MCVCVCLKGGGAVVHEDNLRSGKYRKRGGNRKILFFCLLLWIARHKTEVLEIHTTVENFCDAFFFLFFSRFIGRFVLVLQTWAGQNQVGKSSSSNVGDSLSKVSRIKKGNQRLAVNDWLVKYWANWSCLRHMTSPLQQMYASVCNKWEYIPVAFLLPYYYLYPMHYLPVHHPQWEPIWTSPPSVSSHPLPPTCHPRLSLLHPGVTSLPTLLSICTLCACIFLSLSHTPLCMCARILLKSCDLHGPRSWLATYFAGSYIPCDFPFSPPDTSIG